MNQLEAIELQRARWRRARSSLRLTDPCEAEFGDGGLGRLVPDIRFRVLVLPGDPERHVVDFSDEVRTWWMRECQNPFDERNSDWGPAYRVSAIAASYAERPHANTCLRRGVRTGHSLA